MPTKKDFFKKYDKLTPDQRELYLISENNYPNKWNAIYDNYRRKVKSGKYDYVKSIKGYLNLVTPARKEAKKEIFYKEGGWSFKPSDDKKVAEVLALRFYEDNLDDIKKMQKQNKTSFGEKQKQDIKNKAKKNPTEAFFLGGFDTLDKKTQKQTLKDIKKIGETRRSTSKAKRRF